MSSSRILPLLALIAGVLSAPAHAASFDCKRAGTPVEHLICAVNSLGAADTALGEHYTALLQVLPRERGLTRAEADTAAAAMVAEWVELRLPLSL